MRLSQQATKAREAASKQLKKVQTGGGPATASGGTQKNAAGAQPAAGNEISLSEDLQYDLHTAAAA